MKFNILSRTTKRIGGKIEIFSPLSKFVTSNLKANSHYGKVFKSFFEVELDKLPLVWHINIKEK